MEERAICLKDGKPVKLIITEELAFASERWYSKTPDGAWRELRVVKTWDDKIVLMKYRFYMRYKGETEIECEEFYSLDHLGREVLPTNQLNKAILEQLGLLNDLS